ncbi:hypothetical protein ACWEJ6_46560 [Nonomuraea sp. NPDC004702]
MTAPPELRWEDLPDGARSAVLAQFPPPVQITRLGGTGRSSLTARMRTAQHSFLLRATRLGTSLAAAHQRAMWAGRVMPSSVPTPKMLFSGVHAGYLLTVHEACRGRPRRADLSFHSPDLDALAAMLAGLSGTLTPCPDGAAPISEILQPLYRYRLMIFNKPPADIPDRPLYVTAWKVLRDSIRLLEGDTLLNCALSPRTLVFTRRQLNILGWDSACQGAAYVDAALLAPYLVAAKNRPADVDMMMSCFVPGWRTHSDAALGLACLWTMPHLYRSLYGEPDERPGHAITAEAGRLWLRYLMGID